MAIHSGVSLLCVPFAGGGASFFYPWNTLRLTGVTVVPLQLPGRERRLGEEPYRNLYAAADDILLDALKAANAGPVALFGHCFLGAALAYELTRRIVGVGYEVLHLFVSAARPPSAGRFGDVARLTDEEFLAHVDRATGYRNEAFDFPALRELLLPVLRADFEMDETYFPMDTEPLDVPVTAIFATDDEFVSQGKMDGWRKTTSASFSLVGMPGGHMYLADEPRLLLDLISTTIAS
jgi:surfactin synthase thioesterase subunit